jgi:hypothetical protein
MMRRFTVMMAAVLAGAAAGCSGAGDNRRIIAETCVRDGGAEDMCDCLARQSVKELEKPALEAVVLGAQGQYGEADRAMAAFSPEDNAKFRTDMQGIVQTCGADDYISQR